MIDVSVVIPTFRRPLLLEEAIRSALAEEGVTVEVIVVDDSPEGSAREVTDRVADARVTYMRSEPPSGGRPALVRNSGWPKATGRYVHFLDDDDKVAAGFYAAAAAAFEANPDRGVVFGRIEPFADAESPALARERAYFAKAARRAAFAARIPTRHFLVANLLFFETVLVNSACMIRRECIAPIEGYDAAVLMNEDVDFYCRAIRGFGFVFLDRTTVHYRILSDSLMHGRKNDEKLVDAYRHMYARYRRTHSSAELFAMKLFARTVLRVL